MDIHFKDDWWNTVRIEWFEMLSELNAGRTFLSSKLNRKKGIMGGGRPEV